MKNSDKRNIIDTPPLVSVVITTVDRPGVLRRALTSVLEQTYKDFEVIVVDDGVRDLAREETESFHDVRIRYIAHGVGRGSGAARNTGIRAAKGDFIAFLNDSDEWLSEKLKRQVEVLRSAGPRVALCSTGVEIVERSGVRKQHKTRDGMIGHEVVLSDFRGFPVSTIMMRSSLVTEIGYFDESLPSHQDVDLAIRATQNNDLFVLHDNLVRIHEEPDTENGSALYLREKRIRGREIVLQKQEELFRAYPSVYGRHYFTLGLWCRDVGKSDKARLYFMRAFQLTKNPFYLVRSIIAR